MHGQSVQYVISMAIKCSNKEHYEKKKSDPNPPPKCKWIDPSPIPNLSGKFYLNPSENTQMTK